MSISESRYTVMRAEFLPWASAGSSRLSSLMIFIAKICSSGYISVE